MCGGGHPKSPCDLCNPQLMYKVTSSRLTLTLSHLSIKVLHHHHHQGTKHVMHDPLQQETRLSPYCYHAN